MLLKVITLTGTSATVDVDPLDKIVIIKIQLEEYEGVSVHQQKLIFEGQLLEDEKTVESYNLKDGSILHLLIASRGG